MRDQQPFIIDQVEWHTKRPGNTEAPDHIYHRFRVFVNFLQDSGLTVRTLLTPNEGITDAFAVSTSDLTDEGFEVVRKAYDAWLRRLDHGAPVEDISLLEVALRQIRQK